MHLSAGGNALLRNSIESTVDENLDALPQGSNKDRIMKEFDSFILCEVT